MEANRSKTYILPLLKEYIYIENPKIVNNIINTYLEVKDNENCILLYCSYIDNNSDYERFEKSIIDNPLFIKTLDFEDKVAYILKFPDKYIREYKLFKNGIYSHFGDDCKVSIIRFWNKIYGKNYKFVPLLKKIKQILHKDINLNAKMREELKVYISLDSELGQAYDEKKEMFNLNM